MKGHSPDAADEEDNEEGKDKDQNDHNDDRHFFRMRESLNGF